MNETRQSIVNYLRRRAQQHREAAVTGGTKGSAHKSTGILYDALATDIAAELDVQ